MKPKLFFIIALCSPFLLVMILYVAIQPFTHLKIHRSLNSSTLKVSTYRHQRLLGIDIHRQTHIDEKHTPLIQFLIDENHASPLFFDDYSEHLDMSFRTIEPGTDAQSRSNLDRLMSDKAVRLITWSESNPEVAAYFWPRFIAFMRHDRSGDPYRHQAFLNHLLSDVDREEPETVEAYKKIEAELRRMGFVYDHYVDYED